MNEKTKLLLALQQINNLSHLFEENEYQNYLCGHLIQLQVELKRQLNHYE
jgi:hypothetical protein